MVAVVLNLKYRVAAQWIWGDNSKTGLFVGRRACLRRGLLLARCLDLLYYAARARNAQKWTDFLINNSWQSLNNVLCLNWLVRLINEADIYE